MRVGPIADLRDTGRDLVAQPDQLEIEPVRWLSRRARLDAKRLPVRDIDGDELIERLRGSAKSQPGDPGSMDESLAGSCRASARQGRAVAADESDDRRVILEQHPREQAPGAAVRRQRAQAGGMARSRGRLLLWRSNTSPNAAASPRLHSSASLSTPPSCPKRGGTFPARYRTASLTALLVSGKRSPRSLSSHVSPAGSLGCRIRGCRRCSSSPATSW